MVIYTRPISLYRLHLKRWSGYGGVRTIRRGQFVSEDESDDDFIPDEPMSEIEDNVNTIAKSSTDAEEHTCTCGNKEREVVRDY